MATETEYVDAGEAVDFRNLSPGYIGSAPDVAKSVNYDRILKAREVATAPALETDKMFDTAHGVTPEARFASAGASKF